MRITIYNNGLVVNITAVTISRQLATTSFGIYTKDFGVFGKFSQRGNEQLWMTYYRGNDITTVSFEPVTDEDRKLLKRTILASPGKTLVPSRKEKEGQWCQQIYCLAAPSHDYENEINLNILHRTTKEYLHNER